MKQSIREEEILRIIKERKTISRLELAEIFDLTPARISKIIKSLLDKKIILEKNIGVSTGGSPPIILTINEKIFGDVLGLNLAPKNIFLTIGKINGEIRKRKKYSLEKIRDDDILDFIDKVISNTLAVEKKIGVITVIITGFVDHEKGISIMSPHYKWRNLNIVKHIEDKFDIPVLLEHDVRAMALTEQQIGGCKGIDDFVIFNICEGIGTCTVIDGNLYRGFNSIAGEMGHIVINTSSIRKCSCGKRGCLEAESSNTAIINRITSDIKIGKYSMLKDILAKKGFLDMNDILLAVKKRDFLAIQVTNEAVEYIAQGLNILVSIIDPEKIILVGEIFTSKFLMDTLKFELNKFSLEFQKCIIEPTQLGDELFYYAPIAVVVKNIFENKDFTKKYIAKIGGKYDFD